MSARDDMILALVMAGQPIHLVEGIVDLILYDHACELAEKIRNSPELRDLTDDHMSDCIAAADLIDPGVAS